MWENFSKDTIISQRPCVLLQAHITTTGAGEADATLYDGHNANGRKIIFLRTVDGAMDGIIFAEPLKCEDGLYLDTGSNVGGVLVVWKGIDGV